MRNCTRNDAKSDAGYARNQANASSQSLARRHGEGEDEDFPGDVERAPELLVVDAQRACVSPHAVDGHCVREKSLCAVARRELARKLLEEAEHALARGVIEVEWVGCRAGQERREQMIDALRVEEGGQLGEDFRRGDTEGDNRYGYSGSGHVWANNVGFRKYGEIRAVGREDDIVYREDGHATFGGGRDMAGVHSKHVRGHVRGEVVDNHRELLGKNAGGEFGFYACEDLKHTKRVDESLRVTSRQSVALTQVRGTEGHRGRSAMQCPPTRAQQTRWSLL